MQKVKVHRYVSGKRPDYAPMSSSEEESEDDDFISQKRQSKVGEFLSTATERVDDETIEMDDPRLRRLQTTKIDEPEEEAEEGRAERHR